MILRGYIYSILYAVLCVLLGAVSHKLGLPKQYSRKIVHILVGFEWIILYSFMGAGIHFLVVCLICTLALLLDYFFKILPAMSSDEDNAPGTVYYGVAMSILALISIFVPEMMIPFGIAVFCTSLGDGAAGLVGQLIKKGNPKILGKKSLFGFLANLIVSFGVVFTFTKIFDFKLSLWAIITVALLSASLELVSLFGFDNIFVTLGVAGLSYFLWRWQILEEYVLLLALIWVVIGVIYEHRALTPLGIALAVVLAVLATIALGNAGFILLLVYFASSIITDKVKKRARGIAPEAPLQTKKFKRNIVQVASNGAAAGICALLLFITESPAFAVGFVAALAEALSDTAASGIGALAKKTYDPFRRRICEKGVSGGMSLIGTLSSFCFGVAFSALAYAVGVISIYGAAVVSAAAFLGMIIDSALGSLLQAKFVCKVCGRSHEKPICCGTPSKRVSGVGFITNSTVNLISNTLCAVITVVVCYALN